MRKYRWTIHVEPTRTWLHYQKNMGVTWGWLTIETKLIRYSRGTDHPKLVGMIRKAKRSLLTERREKRRRAAEHMSLAKAVGAVLHE